MAESEIFEEVVQCRLDGTRLLLSSCSDHQESLELVGAVLYLRGTGRNLEVRTITDFNNAWVARGERVSAEFYIRHTSYIDNPGQRPICFPENSATRYAILADVSFGRQHVHGFEGSHFLGRAQRAVLYVVSSDTTRAAVEFHGDSTGDEAAPFVKISVQLSHEVFQSTFKPLWLGSPRAAVDVTVGVCGFRFNGALPDDEEVRDFVMASGAWSAELKSLSLAISDTSM